MYRDPLLVSLDGSSQSARLPPLAIIPLLCATTEANSTRCFYWMPPSVREWRSLHETETAAAATAAAVPRLFDMWIPSNTLPLPSSENNVSNMIPTLGLVNYCFGLPASVKPSSDDLWRSLRRAAAAYNLLEDHKEHSIVGRQCVTAKDSLMKWLVSSSSSPSSADEPLSGCTVVELWLTLPGSFLWLRQNSPNMFQEIERRWSTVRVETGETVSIFGTTLLDRCLHVGNSSAAEETTAEGANASSRVRHYLRLTSSAERWTLLSNIKAFWRLHEQHDAPPENSHRLSRLDAAVAMLSRLHSVGDMTAVLVSCRVLDVLAAFTVTELCCQKISVRGILALQGVVAAAWAALSPETCAATLDQLITSRPASSSAMRRPGSATASNLRPGTASIALRGTSRLRDVSDEQRELVRLCEAGCKALAACVEAHLSQQLLTSVTEDSLFAMMDHPLWSIGARAIEHLAKRPQVGGMPIAFLSSVWLALLQKSLLSVMESASATFWNPWREACNCRPTSHFGSLAFTLSSENSEQAQPPARAREDVVSKGIQVLLDSFSTCLDVVTSKELGPSPSVAVRERQALMAQSQHRCLLLSLLARLCMLSAQRVTTTVAASVTSPSPSDLITSVQQFSDPLIVRQVVAAVSGSDGEGEWQATLGVLGRDVLESLQRFSALSKPHRREAVGLFLNEVRSFAEGCLWLFWHFASISDAVRAQSRDSALLLDASRYIELKYDEDQFDNASACDALLSLLHLVPQLLTSFPLADLQKQHLEQLVDTVIVCCRAAEVMLRMVDLDDEEALEEAATAITTIITSLKAVPPPSVSPCFGLEEEIGKVLSTFFTQQRLTIACRYPGGVGRLLEVILFAGRNEESTSEPTRRMSLGPVWCATMSSFLAEGLSSALVPSSIIQRMANVVVAPLTEIARPVTVAVDTATARSDGAPLSDGPQWSEALFAVTVLGNALQLSTDLPWSALPSAVPELLDAVLLGASARVGVVSDAVSLLHCALTQIVPHLPLNQCPPSAIAGRWLRHTLPLLARRHPPLRNECLAAAECLLLKCVRGEEEQEYQEAVRRLMTATGVEEWIGAFFEGRTCDETGGCDAVPARLRQLLSHIAAHTKKES